MIGSYFPLIMKKNKDKIMMKKKENGMVPGKALMIVSAPVFLLAQYVIITNRSQLFQGYMFEDEERTFQGPLTTICMVFLFLYLYLKNTDCQKYVKKFILLALIELTIALLSFGSRMYVMVTFIAILLFLIDNKKISIRKSFIWVSVIVFLAVAFGIWRKGSNDISIDSLVFVGIMEPAYTWISAISMYDMNELPWLSIPYDFFMTIVNFIPSIILPEKNEWLVPELLKYDAPLGATSVFYSLISNFGILGSFIATFFLGYYLTYVRLYWRTIFGNTYYYCICGVIPFQLFRDPVVTVNKMFFFNVLILPLILLKLSRYLHKISRSMRLYFKQSRQTISVIGL